MIVVDEVYYSLRDLITGAKKYESIHRSADTKLKSSNIITLAEETAPLEQRDSFHLYPHSMLTIISSDINIIAS